MDILIYCECYFCTVLKISLVRKNGRGNGKNIKDRNSQPQTHAKSYTIQGIFVYVVKYILFFSSNETFKYSHLIRHTADSSIFQYIECGRFSVRDSPIRTILLCFFVKKMFTLQGPGDDVVVSF